MTVETNLFGEVIPPSYTKPRGSLLKWIGNKYRMAEEIAAYFPASFRTFYDVFLGSGAILATVAPASGVGSDVFGPLVDIWTALKANPDRLKHWYRDRWERTAAGDKVQAYETIKASYNAAPNAGDLLFLCRSCYGGVVRFRKADGYMSTPCGPHKPITPEAFAQRVDEWQRRMKGSTFVRADYRAVMSGATPGDFVYCDPPYKHSQGILYGAQDFSLHDLLNAIADCKARGVYVALSIDGSKRSGNTICELPVPRGLFTREVLVNCGRSMLKRFQMNGRTLEHEVVADRLLLTY
ncbi:MAG: DNA adenine methylase [Phycisphaerae bacterium]|nr:DNA adenine methylase [Phycisphaerae bacterium]